MFSSFVRKNISIAWPLALNALLMQSMLMIDTLLVSPLGEHALAGMGIAFAIIAFMLGVQAALANGTQLVISRAFGSGNASSLSTAYLSGLLINIICTLFMYGVLFVFGESVLMALAEDPAVTTQASHYLTVGIHLILFNAITQTTIALFNGMGKTKTAFKGYLLELPVNIILSYAFIHYFALGVQGAAMGSLCAIILRTVYLQWQLQRDQHIIIQRPKALQPFLFTTKRHFYEVLPIAVNITLLTIGMTVYQLLYAQLPVNAYVAISLIMPWIRIGLQFNTSWSHASAIMISQLVGSKQLDQLKMTVNKSIHVTMVISALSAVFFMLLHFVLPLIYHQLEEETYQALAAIAPLYIFLAYVRGYNTVHGQMLRAIGKTKEVFKIHFVSQWLICIPLLSVLIFYFDVSIFWAFFIQPLDELIKALPFRQLARKTVEEFDSEKAESLEY